MWKNGQTYFKNLAVFSMLLKGLLKDLKVIFNQFSTHVLLTDNSRVWSLLAKCAKSTCGRVTI